MCGIVGLHLREPPSNPGSVNCSPRCWARSSNAARTRRASRSTATRACRRRDVPSSRCWGDPARGGNRLAGRGGCRRPTPRRWSTRTRRSPSCSPPSRPRCRRPPSSARARGSPSSRAPEIPSSWRVVRARRSDRPPGRRPHPDGHRVGRHPRGRAPVLRRPRSMPGPQRLVRQPRHHPTRTPRPGRAVRQRERLRGRRPLRRPPPRQGADLEKALRLLCERFDGFYTLLVSTADSFAVVRDAIACKPALVAETDAWVAMASEYRALDVLPGIEHARIFEPEPEEVYVWRR
jgi:hypothetical protein